MRRRVVAPALRYLDEAIAEAEAAARWYAERSPAAAVRFTEEIDAAEAAIMATPDAWPVFLYGTRRYLLRRFPFSVVYRPGPAAVLILAVAHGSRRPGYWQARTQSS